MDLTLRSRKRRAHTMSDGHRASPELMAMVGEVAATIWSKYVSVSRPMPVAGFTQEAFNLATFLKDKADQQQKVAVNHPDSLDMGRFQLNSILADIISALHTMGHDALEEMR